MKLFVVVSLLLVGAALAKVHAEKICWKRTPMDSEADKTPEYYEKDEKGDCQKLTEEDSLLRNCVVNMGCQPKEPKGCNGRCVCNIEDSMWGHECICVKKMESDAGCDKTWTLPQDKPNNGITDTETTQKDEVDNIGSLDEKDCYSFLNDAWYLLPETEANCVKTNMIAACVKNGECVSDTRKPCKNEPRQVLTGKVIGGYPLSEEHIDERRCFCDLNGVHECGCFQKIDMKKQKCSKKRYALNNDAPNVPSKLPALVESKARKTLKQKILDKKQ